MTDTASLLREIADEMERSPEKGFMEFEWSRGRKLFKINEDGWAELSRRAADPEYTVRRRPYTITIAGIEIPEPMRTAPPVGTTYWIADPLRFQAHWMRWDGSRGAHKWMSRGLCHFTKEAAETHARVLIIASGGEME